MGNDSEKKDTPGQGTTINTESDGIDMGEPDQIPQTALEKYKPSLSKTAIAAAARTTAFVMYFTDSLCSRIEIGIKRAIDTAAQIPSEEIFGIRAGIRNRVAKLLQNVISSLRKARILESADLKALPVLVDSNEEEDLRMKTDINDFLDLRIGAFLPFLDETRTVGAYAFGKGIPAERLIEYFEEDQILDIMISELLSVEYSRFRGANIYAIVKTLFQSVLQKLKNFAERMEKRPVTEGLEVKIRKNIAYFTDHYDPHDREHTIAGFTRNLMQTYPEYDISGWLKENRNLLREILSKKSQNGGAATVPKPVAHVPNIIREVYEECGRTDPKKFIELNVPAFLSKRQDPDTLTPARTVLLREDINEPYVILDLEQLEYFFAETMPRIATERNSLINLRSLIAYACMDKVEATDVKAIVLRGADLRYNAKKFETTSKLQSFVKETITSTCKVVASHVDIRNLLVDPLDVPDELRENYDICFDGSEEFRKKSHDNFMTRLFGHTSIVEEKEESQEPAEELKAAVDSIDKIKRRVSRLFKEADNYVEAITASAGIPLDNVVLQEIKDTNDYAELVRMACKDPSSRKRFEARRKIELAVLIYNCMGAQRYVNQHHEAKAVRAVLESRKDKLRTHRMGALETVRFIDYKDGRTKIIGKKERVADSPLHEVREEWLIPAFFAGKRCHLMPADSENVESEDDIREYISEKTLFSMLTNLINDKEKRGARDLTDLIRMTFVVDNQDGFNALRRHIERNYVGFGMTLRREDRYGKLVRVQSVGTNKAKADEYKALRYVVDVPVEGEGGTSDYFASVEIRILYMEDFVIDRSKYHPASHARYEKRRVKQVSEKLAPEEIYPETYKIVPPHEDDILCRAHTVLKNKEDYAMAAAHGA